MASLGTHGPVTDTHAIRRAYRATAGGMRRVALEMRRGGRSWEHVWILELSEGLVPNVHVLARADALEPDRFREAATAARLGWADLQRLRYPERMARYVLKLPLAPLDLEVDDPAACLHLHLALNGGRLVTATRRFWLDRHGAQARGLRAARAEARRARKAEGGPSGEPRAWREGWKLPPTDGVPLV
ncbi:MAG: hypothetical protein M3Q23_13145 [Actinomycetota bacterium]|nr:hypothetical protein [Actinomycetota bacterium]